MKGAAIVLAAGGSRRLGQPKQLLKFDGETLVRRTARAALALRGPVVIVVGREQDRIADELRGLPVTVVPNEHWERGIGSSIRRGLAALPDCDAVMLLVCDQPHVTSEILGQLLTTHEQTGTSIVASAYAGTLGVPALFEKGLFSELRSLPDNQGAKSIITAHSDSVATISFPKGAIDIDTVTDYESQLANSRRRRNA
jgi:molybdenum cofactor cytidylyltransferase